MPHMIIIESSCGGGKSIYWCMKGQGMPIATSVETPTCSSYSNPSLAYQELSKIRVRPWASSFRFRLHSVCRRIGGLGIQENVKNKARA